jgi:hypothetical protein
MKYGARFLRSRGLWALVCKDLVGVMSQSESAHEPSLIARLVRLPCSDREVG